MTILKIAGATGLILGLAGTTWGVAWWEMGQSAPIEELAQTQQKVVDWMDTNIQQQRSRAAQLEVLRQLCATGQLAADNPNCVKISAPPMKAPPAKP